MTFTNWYLNHYIPETLNHLSAYLIWLYRVFGANNLVRHLFSPWRRINAAYLNTDTSFFARISTDLISRFIGANIRALTLIVFVITIVVVFLGILVFLPIALLPFWGLNQYQEYIKEHPLANHPKPQVILNRLTTTKFWRFLVKQSKIPSEELATLLQNHLSDSVISELSKLKKNSSPQDVLRTWIENSQDLTISLQIHHHLNQIDLERLISWYEYLLNRQNSFKFTNLVRTQFIKSPTANWQHGYTPLVSRYSKDLSQFNWLDLDLVGREQEINKLEEYLTRTNQPFVIVHGPAGVGRSSLVYQLIKRSQTDYTHTLAKKHFVWFDLNDFLNGQEQNKADHVLVKVIKEIDRAGDIVLVLQNIHELFNNQIDSDVDIEDVFENTLGKHKTPIIGITSTQLFKSTIMPRQRLAKLFSDLEVAQPPVEDVYLAVFLNSLTYEHKSGIHMEYPAIIRLVDLCANYIKHEVFPEKAFDMLELVYVNAQKAKLAEIDITQVNQVISSHTGINLNSLESHESNSLINLEQQLKQHVVDQDEAIHSIAAAIRRNRTNISDIEKPVGSFLFVGPTGVGKTSTALALVQEYFKASDMIRLDMAEYQNPNSIEMLLGSANQLGLLAEKILSHPHTVLLLDEFEKAPKLIHNLFLTILDEGYFVTNNDTRIDCTNLVIIATSNAASNHIEVINQQSHNQDWQQKFIQILIEDNHFSPELLNRFDQIVFFKPLTNQGLIQVLNREFETLKTRLNQSHHFSLTWTEQDLIHIIKTHYDQRFGVRSLQHFLHNIVEDEIAKLILSQPQPINLELATILNSSGDITPSPNKTVLT